MADTGFYVVAFTARPFRRQKIHGRWYQATGKGSLFAVGERRNAPPPVADEELRHQHAVVVTLWEEDDAILPVRFGAYLPVHRIEELLEEKRDVLQQGLDAVRGHVQMNVRVLGTPAPAAPARTVAGSGRAYLERRRAEIEPKLPSAAEAFLAGFHPLVSDHRRQAGAGSLLATVYHLVPRPTLARYREAASSAKRVSALVSGPFPPFAFTPAVV